MAQDVVVVGDVHLSLGGPREPGDDLARVIAAHPGTTVVFAGDLVDLAAAGAHGREDGAVDAILGPHEALRRALGEHLSRNGSLVVLGGNHDADLTSGDGQRRLCDAFRLQTEDRARVRFSPWFARLGDGGRIHVEHGHQYDPDNALPHPLTPPDPTFWSLGIGLMHRFVAPVGAGKLVHDNDAAPLHVLRRVIEVFGPKAPAVIVRYFYAAALETARAGRRYPARHAIDAGEAGIALFAAQWGVTPEEARTMVARGARPTMSSTVETFLRLYWDRTIPLAVAVLAGGSALAGGPGRRVAIAATGALALSMMLGINRYRGRVPDALVAQGQWLAESTDAKAVVFGHIHRAVDAGAYVNTGSFGFPGSAPGRPYVVVRHDGVARRAFA